MTTVHELADALHYWLKRVPLERLSATERAQFEVDARLVATVYPMQQSRSQYRRLEQQGAPDPERRRE